MPSANEWDGREETEADGPTGPAMEGDAVDAPVQPRRPESALSSSP